MVSVLEKQDKRKLFFLHKENPAGAVLDEDHTLILVIILESTITFKRLCKSLQVSLIDNKIKTFDSNFFSSNG